MEGRIKELAGYRLARAKEMLNASEENLKIHQFKTSLNRSYYAIFHAMRAINCLDGYDSSKHSGVIAHFNQYYVKEGKMPRELSVIIKESSFLREKSDYDVFYIASGKDAEQQLRVALNFVEQIEEYINRNTSV